MAVSGMFVLHGIVNSSTTLSQISNARVSPGIQTMVGHAAGLVNPLFVGNLGQSPSVSFDCEQVATILGLTGVSIADLSGANTDMYFKAAADGGSRVADGTSAHVRLRAAQAVLDCASITAGHSTPARASCRLVCYYDGSNEPIVPAGSQALSGTPSSLEHFVAGPVEINGVALPGVQDITIDFGRTLFEVGGDGELYVTFVAEAQVQPTITIRGYNVPWASYGLNGVSLSSLSVFLRKVDRTGRVANATEEHIEFTASAGYAYINETSSGGNDGAMTTVTIQPVAASASSAALAVDTTAKID